MYIEGEVPYVSNGNNGNGMWGGDGIWAILLLALLGNRGFGFGGGFNGGSGDGSLGWQLGRLATTNDVASGFSTSEIMSDLNSIQLSSTQGFAGLNTAIQTGNAAIQQTLCQGFNGVNTAILQSANATERGFAQAGYNLANCCCEIKGAIADVKYANEAQTCQLITNQNANTQRIIDYLTSEKIESLRAENVALKGKISNADQSAYLLSELKPCPKPAYLTCNPSTGLTYPQGYTNVNFGNSCCGL